MDEARGTLHFICGRLAAGKTTLARQLVAQHRAVFFCEDVWLSKLSDGIQSFEDYLKWSRRCRAVMGPLIVNVLGAGTSVVLDFAGNTPRERAWVQSLATEADAETLLHFLDVPEEVCLARLEERNWTRPDGLYFATTSAEEFHAISSYFRPPSDDEGIAVQAYPHA